MLGKLIKNDYINRMKTIFLIYAAVIADSVGILIVRQWLELDTLPQMLANFLGLTLGVMMIAFFISIPVVFFISFVDYQKRFFKDQGYLTHTLPVKTSSLLGARLINDIVLIVSIAIVYPLCGCIIAKDFSVYGNIYDLVTSFVLDDMGIADKAGFALAVFLFLAIMLVSTVLVQWHFNAAYALGHMHAERRRLLSVVYYALLYIIYEAFASIVMVVLDYAGVANLSEDASTIGVVNISFGIVLALQVLSIAVTFIITKTVCQKRLNLE